jgi:uncharacterized membrane protein YedE/YeeE
MGAVFALASGTSDITAARPEAVAAGMQIAFGVGAGLLVVALAIAATSHGLRWRALSRGREREDDRVLRAGSASPA